MTADRLGGSAPTAASGFRDLHALVERVLCEIWGNRIGAPVAGLREHPSLVELAEAIEYSLLAPGKRIRPILALAAAEACGATVDRPLVAVAAAFELVHAYSLVHDDLPCMDDDDLRRGLPTSHRAFGEATALLVGDALQAAAFALVAGEPGEADVGATPLQRLEVVRLLADAAGWSGMVGGQYLDLVSQHDSSGLDAVLELHSLKTGALIAAAVEAGAVLGGCRERDRALFREFGAGLGWLFQLVDDLLDQVGDQRVTGKAAGRDADKVTAVDVLGVDGLAAAADEQLVRCLDLSARMPSRGGRLPELARFVRERDR